MFVINDDKSIFLTRGDIANIEVTARESDEKAYTFKTGDVVRIKVFEKKGCECVVLKKDAVAETETEAITIFLDKEDTKIGDVISKPKDYWYEIELNPDTLPQTIIGYDEDGAKVFRLFPEGRDD
jgi:hypothetical protein